MNELIIIINRLLKKILAETLEIKTEKSDCQKFYYEVLFINIRLFEGAIFLLNQFKESPHFQVSFISIMRDIMSNLILAEYIHQKENDSLANIDEELEKIYSEHYRFKKKSKKIEFILFSTFENYTQFEEYFENLGKQYNSDNGEIKPHLKIIESTYSRIRYIESKLKKHEKPSARALFLWYSEFSKIAHFGELTIRQIANKYHQSNEEQVNENYGYLLITVTKYIFELFIKVLYPDQFEESIMSDFEKILDFENHL
jgi:hypothetical protein